MGTNITLKMGGSRFIHSVGTDVPNYTAQFSSGGPSGDRNVNNIILTWNKKEYKWDAFVFIAMILDCIA